MYLQGDNEKRLPLNKCVHKFWDGTGGQESEHDITTAQESEHDVTTVRESEHDVTTAQEIQLDEDVHNVFETKKKKKKKHKQ